MISLKNHVNTLDFNDMNQVANLLKYARSKVSLFGTRVVEVEGFKGSIALNTITNRVFSSGKSLLQKDQLTFLNRINGVIVSNCLKQLYSRTTTSSLLHLIGLFFNWLSNLSYHSVPSLVERGAIAVWFQTFEQSEFEEEIDVRGSLSDKWQDYSDIQTRDESSTTLRYTISEKGLLEAYRLRRLAAREFGMVQMPSGEWEPRSIRSLRYAAETRDAFHSVRWTRLDENDMRELARDKTLLKRVLDREEKGVNHEFWLRELPRT